MALDQIPWIPQPPSWQLDWPAVQHACAWLHSLANVQQNPIYHAEGDVLTHTHMVAAALTHLPDWQALPATERASLFLAALFHDLGKATTTHYEAGRWRSLGHARAGALQARQLLSTTAGIGWPLPLAEREAIVRLVFAHGLPLQFLESPDLDRSLITASYRARMADLALLAEADVRGRICNDQVDLLNRIAMFREWATEHACLQQPYPFANDQSRVRYLRGKQSDPTYQAYDTSWGEVTLLAGLPGVGKDHWLQSQSSQLPIISLDRIRADLGIGPTENQGRVIQVAKEQARSYLRKQQPFIWNATNLTRQLRDPLIDLFLAYDARVRIVYLHAPLTTILERNQQRPHPVPRDVILRLAGKAEPPDHTEAHRVEWIETGPS